MKKSLIALATLVAFAGAASAQSSVTIGGKLDLGVGKAIGITDKQVRDGAGSRLNFMIVEDLGGGMAAIGGFEHRFNPDTGKDATNDTAKTGFAVAPAQSFNNFWNGFSYVGLRGGFGSVKIGRDYTAAFSLVQNTIDPWGGDTITGMRGTALTIGQTGGTPAGIRFGNGLKYDIAMGGLNFGFDISEKGWNNWGASDPTIGKRPWSAAVNYAAGPLFVGFSHDNRGGANDKLTTLGGRYALGGLTLRAGMSKGSDNANNDVKGYLVGANYRMGAGDLRVGYATYNTAATTGTENKRFAIGYHYDLSKRTKLYADFARDSGNAASVAASRNGYDFGIQHNF